MRLQAIKLAGFKSFVEPTTINFPSSLCAVVGPNGCGKSNIIDAVRWVMGESSAKTLRGESMSDVIFNGSNKRAPLGQASIELLFDNSLGRLQGELSAFTEISVKRLVTRDGQSAYFLNKNRCRRKDIMDLFLGTGLGPRSYSIIEQGMISQLIDSKPEELRSYLEEAAGISKYKERRKETERKIIHTRENLDRLNDIREELANQLIRLERQSKAAEKYNELRKQIRSTRGLLLGFRWQKLAQEIVEREKEIDQIQIDRDRYVSEQRRLDSDIEVCRTDLVRLTNDLSDRQKVFYDQGTEIARIEEGIQFYSERNRQHSADLAEVDDTLKQLEKNLGTDEEKLQELELDLSESNPRSMENKLLEEKSSRHLGQLEEKRHQFQYDWNEFVEKSSELLRKEEVHRTKIISLEEAIKRSRDRVDSLKKQIDSLVQHPHEEELIPLKREVESQELEVNNILEKSTYLTQALIRYRKTSETISHAMDEKKDQLQRLSGRSSSLEALQHQALGEEDDLEVQWLKTKSMEKHQRLGAEILVDDGWDLAVEMVLGDFVQALCVDEIESPEVFFRSFSKGRLAFMFPSKNNQIIVDDDFLSSKVRGNSSVHALLRGIRVAPDLSKALIIRGSLKEEETVITRDGFWLGSNWIRIAKDKKTSGTVIQRQKELVSIKADIERLEAEIKSFEGVFEEAREKIRGAEDDRETLNKELKNKQTALGISREKLGEKTFQVRQIQSDLVKLSDEMQGLNVRIKQDEINLETEKRMLTEVEKLSEADNNQREELLEVRKDLELELKQTREKAENERASVHQYELMIQSIESQIESTRDAVKRLRNQYQELSTRRRSLLENIRASEEPINDLSIKLKEEISKKATSETSLATARSAIQDKELRTRDLESQRRQCEAELEKSRGNMEEVRLQRQTVEVRQSALKEQLEENGNTLEEVLRNLDLQNKEGYDSVSYEDQLEKLIKRLDRLGPINLAALDEHEVQSERKQYLDSQNEDLENALSTLESAIKRIDTETKERFKETFDKVNDKLHVLFPKLFGGGRAYLEMTSDDLLDSGVGIMARPPGKRNVNVHQLSGGEKALAAIALVFSIFDLNPSPFCLLDEVDAPLDDVNVARYVDLVKEMSKTVQFVFITHNKIAMEMGDHLMGVTMQESGVSRLVSVDVNEAVAMVAS